MKFLLYQGRLSHIQVQRNFLVGLCVILSLSILLQTWLLCFKKERVIISPPELTQSYWVEGNRFSNNYIEEMALFFAHLLLDVTEASLIPQGEVLLRYVIPDSYGAFKTKLLQDHKRLKQQQLSLHFSPQSTKFIKPLTLDISGMLTSYVAAQKVGQVKETYRIKFTQKQGRLFLAAFEVVQAESKHEAENS